MNASLSETQAQVDPAAVGLALPSAAFGGTGLGESVHYALAVIRRNLWLIGAILAAALVLGLVATMLSTPRYTAVTSIQINDQSDQVLGNELNAQTNVNSDWDVDRFINTQLEILRSHGLAERVARKLNLFESERFNTAMGLTPAKQGTSATVRREGVISQLQDSMEAKLTRDTRIVEIRFSSTEPELSASIANAFADEFIQANLQRRFDSSAYARNFIGEQLEEARARLETSERELNAYARVAGLIRTRSPSANGDEGVQAGSVTTSSLMQLNQSANEAQAKRIEAEGRWKAEQATPVFSSQAVLTNSAVQLLMAKRAEAEADLATARIRYLPDHPKVQEAAAELASITSQLNQTAASVRESIRADYTGAQSAERGLQQEVNRLQGATMAEQDRAVRYNTLAREADTNRSVYDGLLQRYRELNASAGITASNLAVIDRADVPLVPSSPNLLKNLAIGLFLGMLLAGTVLFLRDQLDDIVRVPEDIEEKIRVPLLGVVPAVADGEIHEQLADPRSPIAEAYGSLRGALLYSTRAGLPKIILVTSAQPTEGKSTSAFACASGFARMGRRALLIDADMRRPSLHRIAGNDNRRGITDLLVSRDSAASAIVPSTQKNLDLLPTGPLPPSPTELLSSPRMAELLEEFAEHYDVVLIDSPPVLGLADAPALAALADGVMFVIEAGKGRHGGLKAALKRLRAVDALLLGAVLTKFDPGKLGGRHSQYYGYSYYRYEPGESHG